MSVVRRGSTFHLRKRGPLLWISLHTDFETIALSFERPIQPKRPADLDRRFGRTPEKRRRFDLVRLPGTLGYRIAGRPAGPDRRRGTTNSR
jgi:hypothetical protein